MFTRMLRALWLVLYGRWDDVTYWLDDQRWRDD